MIDTYVCKYNKYQRTRQFVTWSHGTYKSSKRTVIIKQQNLLYKTHRWFIVEQLSVFEHKPASLPSFLPGLHHFQQIARLLHWFLQDTTLLSFMWVQCTVQGILTSMSRIVPSYHVEILSLGDFTFNGLLTDWGHTNLFYFMSTIQLMQFVICGNTSVRVSNKTNMYFECQCFCALQ